MEHHGECLGLVLAGGQSVRMGTDKGRLRWRGQTLIEDALQRLRNAGCARVLVSGDYPEFPHVRDQNTDRGPLGGLASVASSASESRWLVIAIDQPLVDAGMLRRLLEGLTAGAAQGRLVCRYGEEMLPFALLVDASTRAWLQAAVTGDAGHRSLKALQEKLRIHALASDAAIRACLRGANTPEEWRALQQ
jgi:molybdopterin-guanine dinucleotide biosynthesis protein A